MYNNSQKKDFSILSMVNLAPIIITLLCKKLLNTFVLKILTTHPLSKLWRLQFA